MPAEESCQLVTPLDSDAYQLAAPAEGATFVRQNDLLLYVRPADVQRGGAPTEESLDDNSDGGYERLRVTAPLTVNRPATYRA